MWSWTPLLAPLLGYRARDTLTVNLSGRSLVLMPTNRPVARVSATVMLSHYEILEGAFGLTEGPGGHLRSMHTCPHKSHSDLEPAGLSSRMDHNTYKPSSWDVRGTLCERSDRMDPSMTLSYYADPPYKGTMPYSTLDLRRVDQTTILRGANDLSKPFGVRTLR